MSRYVAALSSALDSRDLWTAQHGDYMGDGKKDIESLSDRQANELPLEYTSHARLTDPL